MPIQKKIGKKPWVYYKVGVGLRIDPEKIKVIWEWEALKIKKGVRAFLGFANNYRAFINKFAITVTIFTVITKKYIFFRRPRFKKPLKI